MHFSFERLGVKKTRVGLWGHFPVVFDLSSDNMNVFWYVVQSGSKNDTLLVFEFHLLVDALYLHFLYYFFIK